MVVHALSVSGDSRLGYWVFPVMDYTVLGKQFYLDGDQPLAYGIAGEIRRSMQLQLAHYVAPVSFHG